MVFWSNRTLHFLKNNTTCNRLFVPLGRLWIGWILLWGLAVLSVNQITTLDAAGVKIPPLVLATHNDIRLLSTPRKTTLVRNLNEGTALDIDFGRERLCWADHGAEAIQCINFNGSHVTGVITNISARAGPISAEGLAIDWYTGNIYWTDGELDTIEVANATGAYRRVLYWTDIDQPRAIALVPMKSLLFWTDWGEVPKIERASMNGNQTTRQVIVSDNIFWPNGMTVDYEAERIYWLDGKNRFISVMDYNGGNRRILIRDKLLHPYAITYFDSRVYWTDWSTWSIYTINISNPIAREVAHSDIVPMALQIWDSRQQPVIGSNPCQINNGGCSHLCLLSPYPPYYNCACPTGILLKDPHTCRDEAQNILLFAQRTYNSKISLDTPDYTAFVIPLKETKHTIALDFDPIDNFLYWTDDELKEIRRARLDGSEEQDLITTEVDHPDGIAVDWIARNVYWTDSGYDRIEVARLNGSSRKVIINEALTEPRAIVVAPVHGWLFWSDWAEKNPKIERSSLDGTERIVIVSTDLGWPNGLALDLENSKVYWGDASTDKIEVANMDGTDRRVVTSDNLPHMFGLSLLGDYLYWTDWQRRSIDRVHKITGKDREVISEPLPNIMGVKAVHIGRPNGTNPCAVNNGNCSHLCLNRPHDYTCACQIGHELDKDNRTCIVPEVFLLFARKENIGRISIENGNTDIIPVTGVKSPKSLDFDITNNRIYWTDIKSHSISRAYLNGSDVQKVLELGVGSPEGMAIDWVAHNVYWTNAEARRIEMARLDGTSRRTLVWKDLDYPSTIVVDPENGFIYWSELGEANRITRAAMDGSQRKIIVHQAGLAQGLALDYESERIFWGDRKSQTIKSVNFIGGDERIIELYDVFEPFGLTLYKDTIYWWDRVTKDVEGANKFDGTNRTKIANKLDLDDLLIFHSSRQSGWNTCAVDNGGCKHLCFALPSGSQKSGSKHVCGCPTHYTLDSFNNTCIAPEEYLIFSQKNMMSRLLPDTFDCPDAVLPFQAKLITAIEYDPVTQFFYWVDGKFRTIRRALDDGTHNSVIVRDGLQPFDLALDPIGRLLFWSDEKDDLINVTRLNNGSAVGVVVKAEGMKPRHIAVHATKRLLFWTDIGETRQIMRARMDGSKQKVISTVPDSPTALAVDPESDMVFWSLEKMVYVSDLAGVKVKKLFLSMKQLKITGIAVLGNFLYWIDSEKQQIERVDKYTGLKHSDAVLSQKSLHLTDIIAVRPVSREVFENHTCSIKNANGKCSHLCIWSPDDHEDTCACPPPLLLHVNKQTCLAKHDCGAEYFTCASLEPSGKECIPITWRCDGQKDCPDESDEQGCPDCGENQFKCQSGQCIERMWVCDGTTHCPDGNDEARCCDKISDFQCPSNGVCITLNKLCDGWEHCADGADESEAICSSHDYRKTAETLANSGNNSVYIIGIIVGVGTLILLVLLVYRWHMKYSKPNQLPYDQATDPLSPPTHSVSKTDTLSNKKSRQTTSSGVRMSMLSGSLTSTYDRSHITGASSSTNGSGCYPRETLNPPPSPATTAVSTRASSSVSRYRPYRHYRSINQPPPPTPCSTDVCDESDSNYHIRSRYEPFPPPPTPRSHCHTESCPPSPSSRSSTNFSPLPPPPSPVPSPPRGYDS